MERIPGESNQAYEAFKAYASLGPGRSIRETCRRLDKSRQLLGKWSSQHHWIERAAAFDDRLDRIAREAEDAKLIAKAGEWAERMQQTREEAYQMASRLVEKAEAMLKFPLAETVSKDGKTIIKPGRWTFADAAKMLDVAHRLKQLVTGLPTDRYEHSGPEGQPLPVVNSQVLFYLPNNGRDE